MPPLNASLQAAEKVSISKLGLIKMINYVGVGTHMEPSGYGFKE